MSIINKQVVPCSWGLFELAAGSLELVFFQKPLGRKMYLDCLMGLPSKYDEFMLLPSRLQAIFVILFLATGACRGHPPISRQLMPWSGEGPSDRNLDARFVPQVL
ncbi:hypothetical protein PISMIDRAFT_683481 [Pisolithus microcarpus 441]|uniref:Uncharacterized protein n=1 Tax=Pisolithus microcarpus 441 TaxID=765257 RepID=A0A0C9Z9K6_9AGAM|nr:hypothetical protein BKA83DRAFT_683481 [Pisolithus microcarpus]KIK19147.1 hypothetical protein PISMIDRAFT_683481 [Pisolithus microcarpus 441]